MAERNEFFKPITGNKFLCLTNYGFQIFSLNGKNEYSIDLLENYNDDIITIHELDEV